MNDHKVRYVVLTENDVRAVATPEFSEGERRILARSGLPGTELFGDNSGANDQNARVAVTMAMLGVKSNVGTIPRR